LNTAVVTACCCHCLQLADAKVEHVGAYVCLSNLPIVPTIEASIHIYATVETTKPSKQLAALFFAPCKLFIPS